MLVLSRKTRQQIRIGDDITVTILLVKGQVVRVGIEAPRDVRVLAAELPVFDDEPATEPPNSDTKVIDALLNRWTARPSRARKPRRAYERRGRSNFARPAGVATSRQPGWPHASWQPPRVDGASPLVRSPLSSSRPRGASPQCAGPPQLGGP